MASTSIYENNQFTYRKPTRNQQMVSGPKKVKGHFPIWLNIAIILVLVAAGGFVGFKLTHPSAHRSPVAIATDFAVKLSAGQYNAAALDVDPADQSKALTYMQQQSGIPGNGFTGVHSTKLGSSTVTGTTAIVVIQACNASLACVDIPPIPVTQIKGSWYVNWTPLVVQDAS